MSRAPWFLSLLLLPALAQARWAVEVRPLDARPYRRDFQPLVSLHARSGLSHLEGLGVELAPGKPTLVFEVPLAADARERELELNLGYLTDGPLPAAAPACEVALEIQGATPRARAVSLPLRSIEPASLDARELRARYDYLTPEARFAVDRGAAGLKLSATAGAACTAGRVVLLNPKVWRKESGEAPKRLIFVPSDSISGDWFDDGRRLMPFVQDWFARAGARFDSRVISVSTNTHDTTNIVSHMHYELREGLAFTATGRSAGLVPAFLEAGYEVISLNSNLLLSTAWQPSGFRYLFNLNVAGTPLNEMNPEILSDMMLDWLRRHPDHDVFLYSWFDATHANGPAPRVRPGLERQRLLTRSRPYSQPRVAQQARSMSYVDLVLERFLSDPLVESADVLFFADHGLNFVTLEHPTPLWGRCGPPAMPANWHVAPEEVRIPVGLRVHGYDPGAIAVETSLLDWVYSAIKHHNPKLDLKGFQGRELGSVKPDDPALAVSHGRRAAIRLGGKHFYLEDGCAAGDDVSFYDSSQKPAGASEKIELARALAALDMVSSYTSLTVEVFHGRGDCQVSLELPAGVLGDGSPAPARLVPDPTRWFTQLQLYVPALAGDAARQLVVDSSADGCTELQAGYVRRHLPRHFEFSASGLWSVSHVSGPELRVGEATVVRVHAPDGLFSRSEGGFVAAQARQDAGKAPELSKEVRAAMKQWGYIQDDQTQH